MPKYKVKFQTEIQVDGWTDFRDREYELKSETVTVTAKNKKSAKIVAVRKAHGYMGGWGYRTHKWYSSHIKSVVRLKAQ